jgi:hypothetical protein
MIDGKQINKEMHHAIWEHHHGPIPKGMEIDHINGNGIDNRLINLRIGTHQQNTFNTRITKSHSSKHRGVSWRKEKRKWEAYIEINQVKNHIAFFNSEEGAARAYDAKAREYFGEFAVLNFPMEARK